ncbi:MAG: metal ABC transporter ATP-binding protein [Halothiobacillaceae bacterium]|jgi:manganese/zinc/iron transport system ATP- binding protein|nr:metal ABC transporter ATP-binding protein [Halothiobacillaceae bacterium]MDY0049342.1 metal ABC transporter ATP-binding protein [Halothiobacillaceae bacterium]
MTPAPALSLRDLTVSYQETPVLWDVTLDLPTGCNIAIIGPNGAGKSSLLKAAMGFIPAAVGEARFFGEPLDRVRARVAYVPQRSEVDWDYPISVEETVMLGRYGGLRWWQRPGAADREEVARALEKVGMSDFARRQISQLSGGQQQRVFLARALAQGADLYLLDEPFAGVDMATERAIVALFNAIRARGGTVIAVHHDLSTVADYFDHVALINQRLIAAGPTETVYTLDNLRHTYGGRLGLLTDIGRRVTEAGLNDEALPPPPGNAA